MTPRDCGIDSMWPVVTKQIGTRMLKNTELLYIQNKESYI